MGWLLIKVFRKQYNEQVKVASSSLVVLGDKAVSFLKSFILMISICFFVVICEFKLLYLILLYFRIISSIFFLILTRFTSVDSSFIYFSVLHLSV